MTDPGNVFLRWARLKTASNSVRVGDRPSLDADDKGATPRATHPANEEPFDPASLPSIESIVADTDIVAFLRAGIPAELTRAALRRAWSSDPAIRDFVGIADNQWDFNDPDAIPGFGPLASGESGTDILAQLSSKLERLTLMETKAPVEQDHSETAPVRKAENEPVAATQLPESGRTTSERPETGREGEGAPASTNVGVRRHGGALPR